MRRIVLSIASSLVAISVCCLELSQIVHACQLKCWTADTKGVTEVNANGSGYFCWYAYSYAGTDNTGCTGSIDTVIVTTPNCVNIDATPPPNISPASADILGDGEASTFTVTGYLDDGDVDGWYEVALWPTDFSAAAQLDMTIRHP